MTDNLARSERSAGKVKRMNKENIQMQIDMLKAHITAMEHTLTVLEKELHDSGASRSSARKGVKESIKLDVERKLAKRRARQIASGKK